LLNQIPTVYQLPKEKNSMTTLCLQGKVGGLLLVMEFAQGVLQNLTWYVSAFLNVMKMITYQPLNVILQARIDADHLYELVDEQAGKMMIVPIAGTTLPCVLTTTVRLQLLIALHSTQATLTHVLLG